MPRSFGPEDARKFYDRFGRKQDLQSFYENPALDDLIGHADFGGAHSVFEFGFGTGRFAEQLLSRHLPTDAKYLGIDISSTMTKLAGERLQPWQGRAEVRALDGTTGIDAPDGSFDRFVSLYVFDIAPACIKE